MISHYLLKSALKANQQKTACCGVSPYRATTPAARAASSRNTQQKQRRQAAGRSQTRQYTSSGM